MATGRHGKDRQATGQGKHRLAAAGGAPAAHRGAHVLPPPPQHTTRLRVWPFVVLALMLAMGAGVLRATLQPQATSGNDAGPSAAPAPGGYFETLPVGAWEGLPDDTECARQIHRSDWEPRPSNDRANHTEPDAAAVHAAFEARPRGTGTSYDPRWNSWLLPRVTGAHTGTTDENIQWAACKWGVSDNLLRAVAALESRWFQGAVDPTGRCVETRGCGDFFTSTTSDGEVFCEEISRYGHDYTADYRPGRCPRTFSIAGVMAWQDPEWGRMPANQNGTFPFSRDSTAFALDYLGSFLRGCYEGWLPWLSDTGTGDYRAGDVWGCVGTWYAGAWEVPAATEYTTRVREILQRRVWLADGWLE